MCDIVECASAQRRVNRDTGDQIVTDGWTKHNQMGYKYDKQCQLQWILKIKKIMINGFSEHVNIW